MCSHRGDSNEYTQYTISNIKKKITQNYPKSAAMGFCSKGLKNEFETAVVNEPSVFEPLKFYCIATEKYEQTVHTHIKLLLTEHLIKGYTVYVFIGKNRSSRRKHTDLRKQIVVFNLVRRGRARDLAPSSC